MTPAQPEPDPSLIQPLLQDEDAILVDLDGTLVDSEAPVRRAWAAFADRHGLDADAVHSFSQGRPSRETIALLLPDADQGAEAAAIERAEVNDTEGVIALPGAATLLRTRQPLAIVTSCSTALATARLAAAGLPVPPVLVSSDSLKRGKPHPECFLLAARRLGSTLAAAWRSRTPRPASQPRERRRPSDRAANNPHRRTALGGGCHR